MYCENNMCERLDQRTFEYPRVHIDTLLIEKAKNVEANRKKILDVLADRRTEISGRTITLISKFIVSLN
jgi:hypothetical protein